MNDDYLWDRSGKPDPEVARLERLLEPLRYQGSAPRAVQSARPSRRFLTLAIAAALLAAAGGALWWFARPNYVEAWDVEILCGAPQVNDDSLDSAGRLRKGQWLVTDDASRAEIAVGRIGRVQIEPNTRVRLLTTKLAEHRLQLERGRMYARIWAPPRLFFVNTPSAEAIDLGCAYTLEVDDQKRTLLHVHHGYVALNYGGREVTVSTGQVCETRPDIGPGTPHDEECTPAFAQALSQVDFEESPDQPLATVLSEARAQDGFTLWHLLRRVKAEQRGRVYDRLAPLAPPPQSVTREGILRLDDKMLEDWQQTMGW